MPAISIPEAFKPILDRIASMSDAELQKVMEALKGLKAHLKPEVLSKQAKIASIKDEITDLPEIVQTLASLSITQFRVDVPLDEFVHTVSRSLRFQKDPPKDLAVFEGRLKLLLNVEAIALSAKAFDIQHGYEKIFTAARIITDIRPVFNVSGTEANGAMIVHNLSLIYSQNGEHKEIVLALDDTDVAVLKKVLERAETKSKTSEQLIEKTDVPYFESK